jgi:tRNA uridine 5-carbamoylmethylation protein Kti12
MLPDYEVIAVVFPTPSITELTRRLMSRPGKVIPNNVIEEMIENFDPPTKDEGFKEIQYIDRIS